MTSDDQTTFNAGSDEEAIRVGYQEYEKLVEPKAFDLSHIQS
mgnify:CR=1 FL=1